MNLRERILSYFDKRTTLSMKRIIGLCGRCKAKYTDADIEREVLALVKDKTLAMTNGEFWVRARRYHEPGPNDATTPRRVKKPKKLTAREQKRLAKQVVLFE